MVIKRLCASGPQTMRKAVQFEVRFDTFSIDIPHGVFYKHLMKITREMVLGCIAFGLSSISALALSLPVSGDTFNNTRGFLTSGNGKLSSLTLNTNQAALLKFDLASLPAVFTSNNITSARLKVYIVSAKKPGDLVVTAITSDWKESPITNTPIPSFDDTIIGSAPAVKVLAKSFVSIDITAAVLAAINGSGSNFGFMLHNTTGQTRIAAKEGPGMGPAAELQIDANLGQDAVGNGTFPGSLNVTSNLNLSGFLRQGSETGTSEPAGRGIIIRRTQLTNSAVGSVVARTDTLTIERDVFGFRVVNHTNSTNATLIATAVNVGGTQLYAFMDNIRPGTNHIEFRPEAGAGGNMPEPVYSFECRFGHSGGHQTSVSLIGTDFYTHFDILGYQGVIWTGTLTSTYNQ